MIGAVFVIGIAGSGKTELCTSLAEWFKKEGQRVMLVNMDPGVARIPYEPDLDIREFIDLYEIMDKYGLGPNGGLLLAMDLIVNHLEKINNEIRSVKPNYLIIDTPGQMEIFAYRASSLFLTNNILADEKLILFLFDGVFCKNPKNFVSTALLSASVHFRFLIPMINVLTKIDLLRREEIRKELMWSKRPSTLRKALGEELSDEEAVFLDKISRILYDHFEKTSFIPVSSVTLANFSNLVAAITRVLFRGEEFLEY